jgi:hypothetical protein
MCYLSTCSPCADARTGPRALALQVAQVVGSFHVASDMAQLGALFTQPLLTALAWLHLLLLDFLMARCVAAIM